MNKNNLSIALAAASFLTAGSTSLADSPLTNGGLSVTPGVGYYSFDNDMKIKDEAFPSIGLEYRFPNNLALEGTYATAETNNENNAGGADFDFSHYHLDALYYFNSNQKLQPYVAAGVGEGTFDFSGADADETLVNIGGGIKYFFTPALSLRGDLRAINSQDNETTSSAATISLAWLLGGTAMSNRQGDFDLAKAPPADADKDGIIDNDDLCPGTPPSVSVDLKGCALDLDKDGIADYRDQCAGTEPNIKVDGVGCPQDLDQDGVADYMDKCLGSTKGHIIDKDGCAVKLSETVSMNLNINFPSNSSILPKEALSDIEELATFMKRYQDTITVIEGHSDNTGDANYNRFLSQKRADAIRKILVTQFNISEDRLKAVGYGEDKPVANNSTADGRKQNRRVIAVIDATIEKEQQ